METIHIDSYDASTKDKHPTSGAETAQQHQPKQGNVPQAAPAWYARFLPAGVEMPHSLAEARDKATAFAREQPAVTAAAFLGLGVLLTRGLRNRPMLRMLGLAGLPFLQRKLVAR